MPELNSIGERTDEGTITNGVYREPEGLDVGPCVNNAPEETEVVQPSELEGYIHDAAGSPPNIEEHAGTVGLEGMSDSMLAGANAHLAPEMLATSFAQSNDFEHEAPPKPGQGPSNVADILADDANQQKNQNTLLFDYGPFGKMEVFMREFTGSLVDEAVAQVVTSHVRQAIHDAVTTSPHLEKDPKSQQGLLARAKALEVIQSNLDRKLDPLLNRLKGANVPEIESLQRGLNQIVESEREYLNTDLQNLSPPTVGGMLFDGLRRIFAPENTSLVGNARTHRNADLTKTLSDMHEVAGELKKNSADKEWVRTQGGQSVAEVNALNKRLQGLTEGVEDQVDTLALRKGLTEVNSLLTEAGDKTEDPAFKASLKASCKAVAEFIKNLTETLGRLFKRDSGGGSVMKPA